MKGLLCLLTTVAALGYGSILLNTTQAVASCGTLDLGQERVTKWTREEVGRPGPAVPHLRIHQPPGDIPCVAS